MVRFTAFAFVAALASQGVQAPGPQDGSEQMITVDLRVPVAPDENLAALREKYAAAVNAADASALASLYAADALVVVADGVVLRGAGEIARYFQDAFTRREAGATVTLQPARFSVENDVASETGGFSEFRSGEPTPTATGVYVTIYTRDASSRAWRIAMDLRTRGRDKQLVRW